MRRLKKWLLLLFALLLVAVGAAMPFAASYMQDARQAGAEVWSFESFSLTLQQEADLSRTLRAVAGGYYINGAVRSEDAALTEGQALEAAENVLTELAGHGLLDKAVLGELSDPRVRAQELVQVLSSGMQIDDPPPAGTAVSSDGELLLGDVIPTWTISWAGADAPYIWLDDASGKAIHILTPFSPLTSENDVYVRSEDWRLFVEDYYGVEARITEEENDGEVLTYAISFPLGEDEEIFRLWLYQFADGYTILTYNRR